MENDPEKINNLYIYQNQIINAKRMTFPWSVSLNSQPEFSIKFNFYVQRYFVTYIKIFVF